MAMDYEFTIKLLEKEVAHYKDLQQMVRSHLDAHDKSLDAAADRMERIEKNLEEASASNRQTAAKLEQLTGEVEKLVASFLRIQPNGGNH